MKTFKSAVQNNFPKPLTTLHYILVRYSSRNEFRAQKEKSREKRDATRLPYGRSPVAILLERSLSFHGAGTNSRRAASVAISRFNNLPLDGYDGKMIE
ncbi:hypothetical protein JTE90_009902 [Oedothorax gibbosus]|uniref:Uncharacterized protein n=1 Tax=Oedothorax gibbosus TaxID=931172 RepID=A0AAV6UW29_9ARAC|nr:hypothetical protein JTE90_009902 [Oedothorax gibbosus]